MSHSPRSTDGPSAAVARVADGILLGAAFAGFGCLIYILYFYYWTGARAFENALTGRMLVLALVGATGVLTAGLKMPAPLKVNVALALCSVTICLYAVETVVSVWSSLPSVQEAQFQRKLAEAARNAGLQFDRRTKAQVVTDLRARRLDAVPSMYPKGLLKDQRDRTKHSPLISNDAELLPLASISNRVTVVCNEGGEYLTYTSDEHGFHNPTHVWHEAPVDVVVLGDSFVQGWCVPSDRNFVSLIRRRYPSTVSLGIEGDGPLTMLATLREYGPRLRPRIVVWCYFEANDISDLMDEGRSPLLRGYLDDSFNQRLIDRQPQIDRALNSYIEEFMDTSSLRIRVGEVAGLFSSFDHADRQTMSIMKLTALRSRLGMLGGTSREGDAGVDQSRRAESLVDTFNLLRQTLLAAKRLTEEQGGMLYFAYLPARDRYEGNGSAANPDREAVLKIARDLGLAIIDLDPPFASHRDPLGLFPFHLASHYGEEGQQLVADTILAHLPR